MRRLGPVVQARAATPPKRPSAPGQNGISPRIGPRGWNGSVLPRLETATPPAQATLTLSASDSRTSSERCLVKRAAGSRLRSGGFVHDVVLACVVGHFQSEFLARPDFRHGFVLNLHGLNALAEVAGATHDMNHVTRAQTPRLQAHRRDRKLAVIVGYGPDAFLARQGSGRRRGSGWFGRL